jgi:hypothetical protein
LQRSSTIVRTATLWSCVAAQLHKRKKALLPLPSSFCFFYCKKEEEEGLPGSRVGLTPLRSKLQARSCLTSLELWQWSERGRGW